MHGVSDRARLIRQAAGREPADLVIRNVAVLDVISGVLREADVALCGERIAGVGRYEGREEIGGHGLAALPGLIDGHMHLEASMLSPEQFARVAVPGGTTTVVADPHEIANVAGMEGLRYLLDAAATAPLDVFLMAPSCVPATHLETSGAQIGPGEVEELLSWPGVLGLGEVMNFPGVVAQDREVLRKIAAAAGRVVDGHAPRLSGPALQAYLAAGPRSDHESTTLEEAREKLDAGMMVMVREGGAARNLATLCPLLQGDTAWRCALVTDDCNARRLAEHGHLDHLLREAVALGIEPHVAVRCLTLVPTTYFRLFDRGVIAPGLLADIVLVDSVQSLQPRLVLKRGRVVARDGELVADCAPLPLPQGLRSSCHLPRLTANSFALPAPEGARQALCRVITAEPAQIVTGEIHLEVPCRDGCITPENADQDVCRAAVIHRHGRGGGVGLGLVQGFGLRRGALASTVAHDSHNLVVVGRSVEDMLTAVRALAEMGGGQVAVAEGEVLASLALPIAGLMSPEPLERVVRGIRELEGAAGALGCTLPDPFMTLSFLALPVMPHLKLTDLGLVQVDRFEVVPVVV